jgi:S1-C subfamily serine protease
LGAKILEYCAVIIDPFSKKIKFEPYSMSKTIEMKGTEKNEVISFVDSKLTIVMINENSKLYKLGARKNDVILEIDGVIVSDICSLLAIKNALSDTSNHKIKMIDLNGNLKMFEIK